MEEVSITSDDRVLDSTKRLGIIGAPGEIRTPDLVVRSHALYPTELRARIDASGKNKFSM